MVPGSQNSAFLELSQRILLFGSVALFNILISLGFKMERIGVLLHLSGVLGKSETKSSENKTVFLPFGVYFCFVGVPTCWLFPCLIGDELSSTDGDFSRTDSVFEELVLFFLLARLFALIGRLFCFFGEFARVFGHRADRLTGAIFDLV